MTIKNSLISVAAAALIVAGVTGCGGSSGSSSNTGTPPATTTGIQSEVKAVDGYIYNATVKAYYVTDDNTTMGSVTLAPAKKTTKNTSTGDVTLGSSTYSLADSNASIKDKIRFFTVATTASNDDGNVTFTPAAYIEADGVNGYDTNDTLLGSTVIYAPATSGIASPVTNLIYQANTALFGTTTTAGTAAAELNSTVIAQIESNASKIAENLGLGDVNILTADPIELAATNPTFKLVTALLKDAGPITANAILAVTTAPTNLVETIATVNTAIANDTVLAAANPNAVTFIGSLNTMAQNGAITAADLANINIEKSIAQGSIQNLVAPTIAGKFPVSSITVDSKASSELAAAGAKWNGGGTVDVNMSLASSDANVSNTSFSLLVAFKGTKDNMRYDDTNNSSSVVAEIPFDLNISNGTVYTAGINAGSIIKYQVKSLDGSEVVSKSDINASTITGIVTGVAGDVKVSGDILKFNVANILTALKNAGDANTTANLESFDGIADVQVLLKDSSGSIVGATGTTSAPVYLPLAKANFTDIGTGAITGAEAIKLVSNSTVDMRGDSTGANTVPVISAITAGSTLNDINTTAVTNSATMLAKTIVMNAGQGDVNITAAINATVTGNENNNSVVLTESCAFIDLNKTSFITDTTDAVTITIDTNATPSSYTTASVLTAKVTDEFGKANTADANVSFLINRGPVFTTNTQVYDVNVSGQAAAESNTSTSVVSVTDDGTYDLNTTITGSNASVNIIKYYDYRGTALAAVSDVNISATLDANLTSIVGTLADSTGVITWDVNSSTVGGGDYNVTVQYNVTDAFDANSTEKNATIRVAN